MTLPDYPDIKGTLEIRPGDHGGIFIGGDPEGLKSLAEMLLMLADADQEAMYMTPGTREHVHLHPKIHLSRHSLDTELCRLDAAGTGEFPQYFNEPGNAEDES